MKGASYDAEIALTCLTVIVGRERRHRADPRALAAAVESARHDGDQQDGSH
jgi:hypothetical protein